LINWFLVYSKEKEIEFEREDGAGVVKSGLKNEN